MANKFLGNGQRIDQRNSDDDDDDDRVKILPTQDTPKKVPKKRVTIHTSLTVLCLSPEPSHGSSKCTRTWRWGYCRCCQSAWPEDAVGQALTFDEWAAVWVLVNDYWSNTEDMM